MLDSPSISPRADFRPPAALSGATPALGGLEPVTAQAISLARRMLAQFGAQDWELCFAGPRYAGSFGRLFAQMHEKAPLKFEPLSEIGRAALIGLRQDGVGLRNQLYPIPFGVSFSANPAFALVHLPLRVEGERAIQGVELLAAPTGEQVAAMLEMLDRESERGRVSGVAPVVRQAGENTKDLERTVLEGEAPLLAEKNRLAVQREISDFFSPQWRTLAEKNRIPYRRGVLLFGPPGNGKTSALRDCLHAMPQVAAVFCRPSGGPDIGATLENAVAIWRRTAPAVLVIEDIDSLFTDYPVSAFLNMLDGVVPMKESGLLVVATTNRPESLDPALNNRPGRFDVAIRFGAPDAKLRRAYF